MLATWLHLGALQKLNLHPILNIKLFSIHIEL
jgi:hypothetical protein